MKRGLATTILLLCVVVLPGQASADHSSFTVAVSPVAESAGNAVFTVTLNEAATEDVILNYRAVDGSFLPGDPTSGQVKIAAGATSSEPVSVPVRNDNVDEDDATFTVSVTHGAGTAVTGTATITDDDAPPVIESISDLVVTEGHVGTVDANFVVTLARRSGKTITVKYSTAEGTADSGDYTGVDNGTLTIEPGATVGTITIKVKGDTVPEPDQHFFVNLFGPVNVTLGSDSQGKATITNDDAEAVPTITDSSGPEGNAGTLKRELTVTVAESGRDVTFNYRSIEGSATASGSAPDYQVAGGAITIDAGKTTAKIELAINGDMLDENDEAFTVELLRAGAVVATATVTIENDDHNSKLSISDTSANEPSSGTVPLAYTVTLEPASARTVTVGYGTMDGTAATGIDYTPASGTLTFAPGVTTQNVTVEVLGDTINEDNETVLVNLVSEAGAGMFDRQGQGTIIDKNAPPSLSISDTTGREGDGAKFNVELAGNTLRAVTVTFNTTDGTAREPGDYAARRGTLTFAPGEKTKTIEVSVADDTLAEPFETFSVSLGDPVNATITKNRGTATIEANDQAAPASQNPPGPTVKPAATPKVLLPKMVLAPRTVKVTVGGLARLFLTCAKASPITCSGSVTLQTTGKPAVKIGSKTFLVKKGKKQTLGVKLSPKARKLLTLRPTLRARVVVLVKTGKKSLRVVPGVITLKAAAKPKTTARPAP